MENRLSQNVYTIMRKIGADSLYMFAKFFMIEHLKYLPAAVHREIYEILQEISRSRGKKIAIAGPRNLGKTTLIMLIYIIYLICYGREKFIVLLASTQGQSMQTLENVRKELTENPRLAAAFPEIFESKGRPKPPRWKRDDIITRNGIEILALGAGQQIRGRKFGNSRPTLIAGDDMENDSIIFSSEARDKSKNWYATSVLRAGAENTNFILLGNIFHPYSLLGEYTNPEKNPDWISRIYKAIPTWPSRTDLWGRWENIYRGRDTYKDGYGPKAALLYYTDNCAAMDEGAKLLWPERQSLYDLMLMHEENPVAFMAEMQNDPIDLSLRTFRADEYDHWTSIYRSEEDLLLHLAGNIEFFLACDPATGEAKGKGDFSALAIIARDTRDCTMYLLKVDIRRCEPNELIQNIITYHKRYKFRMIAIEANNFQTLLVTSLENEAVTAKITLPIERIINHGNKIERISKLQPILKSGRLKLSKNDIMLRGEMDIFPRGLHEDGLDSVEMCVRTCENNKNVLMLWSGDLPGSRHIPHGGTPQTFPQDGTLVPYGYYRFNRMG